MQAHAQQRERGQRERHWLGRNDIGGWRCKEQRVSDEQCKSRQVAWWEPCGSTPTAAATRKGTGSRRCSRELPIVEEGNHGALLLATLLLFLIPAPGVPSITLQACLPARGSPKVDESRRRQSADPGKLGQPLK